MRDVRVGTGISKSLLLDWGSLSVRQTRKHHPDAVVVFIGANEGFPMKRPRGGPVDCCGSGWAAAYANRARRMMNTYRQAGAARVYWLLLPLPRDGERKRIARAVNAAIAVAAEPYRAQVRVLDIAALFTPGGRYRDAMDVGGRQRIVREADGIHLNDEGAAVALGPVLAWVWRRRPWRPPRADRSRGEPPAGGAVTPAPKSWRESVETSEAAACPGSTRGRPGPVSRNDAKVPAANDPSGPTRTRSSPLSAVRPPSAKL